MSSGSAFEQIWSDEKLRSSILSRLHKDDLKTARLVCKTFSTSIAPVLFCEKHVTFQRGLFTRPSWLALLDRLGPHVQTFHFHMPHGTHTALPPLIDDFGQDVPFIYEPYTGSTRKAFDFVPPYGSQEVYDLLTKHYPTIFHAAANVPSFIRVFSSLTNVRHLKISTPGQARSEAYLRSAVDYALISLRIAVERNKLVKLDTLSLLSVHPGAPFYLNPFSGFGARPNSLRRWKQIKKLTIEMDTPPTSTLPDHLKFCHHYLQVFAATLVDFDFRWQGAHAPWPLTLHNEPMPNNDRCRSIHTRRSHLSLSRLRMPNLRNMYAANIAVDAWQISAFVERNRDMMSRHNLCSLEFKESTLRSGTWDEALAPFSRISGSDRWAAAVEAARKEADDSVMVEETLEVPLIMSPLDLDPDPPVAGLELLKPVRYEPLGPGRLSKFSPHLGLHRASARTKDLLQDTEEHMRELFRASIFSCWRRGGSVLGMASRCA